MSRPSARPPTRSSTNTIRSGPRPCGRRSRTTRHNRIIRSPCGLRPAGGGARCHWAGHPIWETQMNCRERYTRAITFSGPDRVPVMHRTIPGAFRRHGGRLETLYERYPSDVLLSPSTRAWFAFRRGVAESSGALKGAVDEWGCVWDSLNDDYLGQVFGHPLEDWAKR